MLCQSQAPCTGLVPGGGIVRGGWPLFWPTLWLGAGWGLAGAQSSRKPGACPLTPRTACAPGEVTMQRSGALDPWKWPRLNSKSCWLEWEAGLHGFLSLLTGIYESCCEVRCEPHGKFQLCSRKCIHCGLIGGHLLSLGYARPTWSPRQMRRQGFQTQGVDVIGADRSLG